MMLWLLEIKKITCSLSYILFVLAVTAALYSQGALDFSDSRMSEPKVGENYGVTKKEIPEIIMPAALESLWGEFCENNYATYPFGFIKRVRLDESERKQIEEIISEITGVDKDTILKGQTDARGDESPFEPAVRANMDYSEFKELMQRIDDILGGGSDYSAESLIGFGNVPVSYEEALQNYNAAVDKDKVTGGYARLFSDYAVAMVMSVLPVFLAIIMCMKDRRAKMEQLIYVRKASSAQIIIVRYCAVVAAAILPVIILSYISSASVWGMYPKLHLDYLAPLQYDLGWIMPSVMVAAAVGMCLTELTNTPIAAVVQGFWWLLDINAGIRSGLAGYSLFRLAPRHNAGVNSYFRTQDYINGFGRLAVNRLLAVGVSVLLVGITIVICERKRRGKWNGNFSIKYAVSRFRSR